MEETTLVFVYGTLRKHNGNHCFLKSARCVAEQSWTQGRLFESISGLPFLDPMEGGRVYGELYEVNIALLQHLDRLEGFKGSGQSNFYCRVEQMVHTDRGPLKAFVYVIPNGKKNEDMKSIEGGDWRIHSLLKKKNKFLYFAYASCMDHQRFKSAGVDHHFQNIKGRGTLRGYSLRFTRKSYDGGRADIVEEGGIVEGILYEVSEECLRYLYQREGVAFSIYRPALVDIELNGKTVENVLTFIVVDKDEETAPSAHYLEEIFRGGSGFLSETYMEEMKKRFEASFNLSLE